MALEAQWWVKGGREFQRVNCDEWLWRLLIRVPDTITTRDLASAVDAAEKKKGPSRPLRKVVLYPLDEGWCVQVLHIGPYGAEQETIIRLHEFAAQCTLTFHGEHHELYFSDPRRVPEARLKTIIRQPVTR